VIVVRVQARDSTRSHYQSLVDSHKEHGVSAVQSLSPTGQHGSPAGENGSPSVDQDQFAAEAGKSLDGCHSMSSPSSSLLMVNLREHMHALCQKVQCDLEGINANQDDPGRVEISWHLVGGALATMQFTRADSGVFAPTGLTLWLRPAPDAGAPDH
jgi:hypothetical protein